MTTLYQKIRSEDTMHVHVMHMHIIQPSPIPRPISACNIEKLRMGLGIPRDEAS